MPLMTLKVLLPFEVFADEKDVSSIVVETAQGSYGLLPQRLDCVAALAPGILSFKVDGQDEQFFALDAGVVVKTGKVVLISVRRALRGNTALKATTEAELALVHMLLRCQTRSGPLYRQRWIPLSSNRSRLGLRLRRSWLAV